MVIYEVEEAEDGKIALEKVRENIPDIIFMDIRMSVMDGIVATQEIFKEFGRVEDILQRVAKKNGENHPILRILRPFVKR